MGQLDKLEAVLDDVLGKKSPVKLPPDARKGLAGAMWWLALIFGIFNLWTAWNLWRLGHAANNLLDYANSLSAAYGGAPVSEGLGLVYYLSVGVVAASAVLLLLAAPGLKAMRKAGWNLLFYGLLVNVAYGVVALFTNYHYGGGVFGAFVGSAVGAFLLFQVREHFTGAKSASAHKVS